MTDLVGPLFWSQRSTEILIFCHSGTAITKESFPAKIVVTPWFKSRFCTENSDPFHEKLLDYGFSEKNERNKKNGGFADLGG